MKSKRFWLSFLLVSVCLAPTLGLFFTHDDFFCLRISRYQSLFQYLTDFDLTRPQRLGFGWFRPISLQTFFAIDNYIFNSSPVFIRLISFIFLLIICVLVYKLVKSLTKNHQISSLAVFFYLTASTQFTRVAFFGNQELVYTTMALATLLSFTNGKIKTSLLFFLLSLGSKEFSVMLPFIMLLILIYQKRLSYCYLTIPFFLLSLTYGMLHLFGYGLAHGDSYQFSLGKANINALAWYGLWSIGVPEMWVDFIGPGLKLSPSLMRYWPVETASILSLLIILFGSIVRSLFNITKSTLFTLLFGLAWFVLTISPVLILPWHKFSFYLTLPFVGISLILASLLKSKAVKIVWILLFIFNTGIFLSHHWLSHGPKTTGRVHVFVQHLLSSRPDINTLIFYDRPQDQDLPWAPSRVLRDALSDQNYFLVFTYGKIKAEYQPSPPTQVAKYTLSVPARDMLDY
jgi:hypothetical protein